jgi:hypothetical protein
MGSKEISYWNIPRKVVEAEGYASNTIWPYNTITDTLYDLVAFLVLQNTLQTCVSKYILTKYLQFYGQEYSMY